MKRFDLSLIMTSAHLIRRATSCPMGEALKRAWKNAKSMEQKNFTLETYEYAGTQATGFNESLYVAVIDGSVAEVLYPSREYPNGKRYKKQNDVLFSATGHIGWAERSNGKMAWERYDTGVKEQLAACTEVKGNTYAIRSELREMGFQWAPETKSWKKA